MTLFRINAARWPISRLFARNALVRISDRVEATVLFMAIAISLVAVPIAGAVGTAVYESSSLTIAEQARTQHAVVATAIEDSTTTPLRYSNIITARARWQFAGQAHTGTFGWDSAVESGAAMEIWVNSNGDHVGPPAPPSQAGVEAVGAGLAVGLTMLGMTVGVCTAVRRQIDRVRLAGWERELRSLADDGGHANKHS
jgi:hypothetical protein